MKVLEVCMAEFMNAFGYDISVLQITYSNRAVATAGYYQLLHSYYSWSQSGRNKFTHGLD